MAPANIETELRISWVAVGTVVAAAILFLSDNARIVGAAAGVNALAAVDGVVFGVIVILLLWGNLVHQIARIGYLRRLAEHAPRGQEELEHIYDRCAPRLTVLIPSYKEEARVLR